MCTLLKDPGGVLYIYVIDKTLEGSILNPRQGLGYTPGGFR